MPRCFLRSVEANIGDIPVRVLFAAHLYQFEIRVFHHGLPVEQAEELCIGAAQPDAEEPRAGKRYVCRVCGYVYEGETIPGDIVCPWCKKGAEYFDEMKG